MNIRILTKGAEGLEPKYVTEGELVDWFKGHIDDDGTVTEDIVIFDTVELKAVDEEGITWTLTDYSLDRDQERIDPDGWDFSNYKNNPVVLWAHDPYRPAIGKMTSLRKATRKDGTNKEIVGKVVFDGEDDFAAMIERKVHKGIITKGSVGFRSTKVELNDDDKEPAQLIHRKQELYEFSIVNIPSNVNASARLDAEAEIQRDIANAVRSAVQMQFSDLFDTREETKDRTVHMAISAASVYKPISTLFKQADTKPTYVDLLFEDNGGVTSGPEDGETSSPGYMFDEKKDGQISLKELLNGT